MLNHGPDFFGLRSQLDNDGSAVLAELDVQLAKMARTSPFPYENSTQLGEVATTWLVFLSGGHNTDAPYTITTVVASANRNRINVDVVMCGTWTTRESLYCMCTTRAASPSHYAGVRLAFL